MPAPDVRPEVEHRAVIGGIDLLVARRSYGLVSISARGRLSGRELTVFEYPDPRLADADLTARAEALAGELAALGMVAP